MVSAGGDQIPPASLLAHDCLVSVVRQVHRLVCQWVCAISKELYASVSYKRVAHHRRTTNKVLCFIQQVLTIGSARIVTRRRINWRIVHTSYVGFSMSPLNAQPIDGWWCSLHPGHTKEYPASAPFSTYGLSFDAIQPFYYYGVWMFGPFDSPPTCTYALVWSMT